MNYELKVLIIFLAILVFIIAGGLFLNSQIKIEKEDIVITTDKTEYEQGENIKITVKNDLNKPIWCIKEICPPSCCSLYRWENNEWKKLGDPMSCWSPPPPLPGGSYLEGIEPDPLEPGESIRREWNMTKEGELVESGKYRFSFYYGLSKNSYTEKTIYSNEFAIKEKTSEILTIDYVLKHSEELTNKTISVGGTANNNKNRVICTKGPGCNKCDSPLILEESGQSIEISGRLINTIITCTGTDCEGIKECIPECLRLECNSLRGTDCEGIKECIPLTKGKFYVVKGIWNGKSLDIESWTEKSAVDPRCSKKVQTTGKDCYLPLIGYEFDSSKGKCIEKSTTMCEAEIPFAALEECRKVCENECFTKIPITINLPAVKAYSSSVIDSDYIELRLPKNLCINSYPSEIDGYYIVQFKGSVYEDYKNQVESQGGIIYHYIPKNAFIVKMNESVKDKVQNLEIVRWTGIYQPAYKMPDSLIGSLNRTGNVTLTVGFFAGENAEDITNKIKSLGGNILATWGEHKGRITIDASKIPDIANILGIQFVEEYKQPKIF